MKALLVIIKKEIKELVTPQMIIPFVVMVIVFMGIGKIMGEEVKKQNGTNINIAVIDEDKSTTSKFVISSLSSLYKVSENYSSIEDIKSTNINAAVIFSKDFEENLINGKSVNVQFYSLVKNVSLTSGVSVSKIASIPSVVNEIVKSVVINENVKNVPVSFITNPIIVEEYVGLNGKIAKVSINSLSGYVMSQTALVPMILFLVITLSSQLVATAIASEKENKTLETLLTLPIDRKNIVAGKLIAGGVVALFVSALYLFGMRSYMNGIASASGAEGIQISKDILIQLGISMNAQQYVILGASLFLGILVALSFAFILGTFAKDVKSIQGLITPLMVMLLIPYLLTLLMDISSLPSYLKIFVYAIPFTHTFTTASNLMSGNYLAIYIGMLYLLSVFIVSIILASKLFASEKIFTANLKFRKGIKLS